MIDGLTASRFISSSGFTHLVWIPDSSIGVWENALEKNTALKIIRPAREGEAIAIAAGLIIGGAKPLVAMQCTGLFEAGDALRNVVHDLKLPLKLIIGVRSYRDFVAGKTTDNCPRFTQPILNAWEIPYTLIPEINEESGAVGFQQLANASACHSLVLGE